MPALEDIKAGVERVSGIWRPSRDQALTSVREVRAATYFFDSEPLIPNNPDLPLVIYKRVLKFPKKFDPAATIEQVFEANGWSDGWRDSIYDWMHFHSRTHEVLGVAKGTAQVRFGGDQGRDIAIAAGDVIVLPAGTGHQKLTASDDFLVVGAYPSGGDYDERKVATASSPKTIRQVPLPKSDPLYGKTGGIIKIWRGAPKNAAR